MTDERKVEEGDSITVANEPGMVGIRIDSPAGSYLMRLTPEAADSMYRALGDAICSARSKDELGRMRR